MRLSLFLMAEEAPRARGQPVLRGTCSVTRDTSKTMRGGSSAIRGTSSAMRRTSTAMLGTANRMRHALSATCRTSSPTRRISSAIDGEKSAIDGGRRRLWSVAKRRAWRKKRHRWHSKRGAWRNFRHHWRWTCHRKRRGGRSITIFRHRRWRAPGRRRRLGVRGMSAHPAVAEGANGLPANDPVWTQSLPAPQPRGAHIHPARPPGTARPRRTSPAPRRTTAAASGRGCWRRRRRHTAR